MTDKAKNTPADTGAANDTETGGRLHDATTAVREKVGDALGSVTEKTSEAYGSAREKASAAYDSAREKATSARQATSEGIENSPFLAVAGGLAFGAVLGALLPRTQKEDELLAPVADRLSDAARSAFSAARDAGKQSLDEMGLNREAAVGKVEKLVDNAVKAAGTAGSAAADAVRKG